jgi:hypothetical protein
MPVALGRYAGSVERFRGVLERQVGEAAQLHEPGLEGIWKKVTLFVSY